MSDLHTSGGRFKIVLNLNHPGLRRGRGRFNPIDQFPDTKFLTQLTDENFSPPRSLVSKKFLVFELFVRMTGQWDLSSYPQILKGIVQRPEGSSNFREISPGPCSGSCLSVANSAKRDNVFLPSGPNMHTNVHTSNGLPSRKPGKPLDSYLSQWAVQDSNL